MINALRLSSRTLCNDTVYDKMKKKEMEMHILKLK